MKMNMDRFQGSDDFLMEQEFDSWFDEYIEIAVPVLGEWVKEAKSSYREFFEYGMSPKETLEEEILSCQ